MKIYSCPKEVPPPQVDYSNYDHAKVAAAEEKHLSDLKAWLRKAGFTGKNTGKIYSEGVADGSADYMIADGRTFFLVHLPYGDGYQSRNVQFLPKKEIIRRCYAREQFDALFTKKD